MLIGIVVGLTILLLGYYVKVYKGTKKNANSI